jgi:Tol biopolymer transport system component
MDERRLEGALHQGPPFATQYVPVSLALDEQLISRRPVSVGRLALIVVVTALLLVALLAGVAILGTPRVDDPGGSNGWVAFARYASDPSPGLGERDIYLVREGQVAHRIIGSDTDSLDQICPAFSPDGARLAHGEAEGTGTGDVGGSGDTGYPSAALVISDLDAAGNATESRRIDVGGTFPPPCANWSPDGRMVAFGVPATSPINPERSAIGSEVWVVTLEGAETDVLPDLLATDLEWSPDGSELAIASGQTDLVAGEQLLDGAISLYSVDSGDIRILVGPSGVSSLSWSPDGTRIAYQRSQTTGSEDQEIWVAEVDGSAQYLLASGFSSDHGIGPVWSPTGDWIAYQRLCDRQPDNPAAPCREQHEVVLIPAGGELGGRTPGEGEVVRPYLQLPGADASALWWPFRVTWSPDGTELLYMAWGAAVPPAEWNTALIAVPIDPNAVPVVLHEDINISVYGGDGVVPIQSWGSRLDEQP